MPLSTDEFQANLRKFISRFKSGVVAGALYRQANVEATEVKRQTPVGETGDLRASVHVMGPFIDGNRVWCLIVCGGVSAAYAIYVHEDLEAIHKVGNAKFLEQPIHASRSYMGQRVADDIKKTFGGA